MVKEGDWSLGSEVSLFVVMLALLEKGYIENQVHMTVFFSLYKITKRKIFASKWRSLVKKSSWTTLTYLKVCLVFSQTVLCLKTVYSFEQIISTEPPFNL